MELLKEIKKVTLSDINVFLQKLIIGNNQNGFLFKKGKICSTIDKD